MGLIAIDASVLIGFLDNEDAHHVHAQLFLDELSASAVMDPVNLAEALVGAEKQDKTAKTLAIVKALGIRILPGGAEQAARIAGFRVKTGLKLPDCYALDAARFQNAQLFTFDEIQAARAIRVGIELFDISSLTQSSEDTTAESQLGETLSELGPQGGGAADAQAVQQGAGSHEDSGPADPQPQQRGGGVE
jgi:predicted nucleic acid-binding protein